MPKSSAACRISRHWQRAAASHRAGVPRLDSTRESGDTFRASLTVKCTTLDSRKEEATAKGTSSLTERGRTIPMGVRQLTKRTASSLVPMWGNVPAGRSPDDTFSGLFTAAAAVPKADQVRRSGVISGARVVASVQPYRKSIGVHPGDGTTGRCTDAKSLSTIPLGAFRISLPGGSPGCSAVFL